MKATIKDIAKIAKVSATAVSMALNGREGVSVKTRSRILQIAEKMNYRPNQAARSLISRRSSTIGLIIPDIADPFYPELAKGIEEKANALGYNIILSNTGRSLDKERRSMDGLLSRGVDGIIFSTVTVDDPNIDLLMNERFPFVLVNRVPMQHPAVDKIDYVIVDSYSGGYKAIEHLFKLGHDRIAVITGFMKASTAIERTRGARQAISDCGLKLNPRYLVQCNYSRQEAYEAAVRLLGLKNAPTAFFAQDDNMALGVREAVLSLGLKVPEDIAIIGFDDIDICALTGIELSTMSQKKYEMGVMATATLINKIEGDTPSMVNKIVLDTELIIRKSCGYSVGGYSR